MPRVSTVKVPFGILNIKGLMKFNSDYVIEQPIFAHSTYPITTTLDPSYAKDYGNLSFKDKNPLEGKSYQKLYRKSVRWNFGDGTEVDGYSATHSYDIPGKYTVTCTFFDINRQGIQNEYSLQVIVKQVIPTVLIFDKTQSQKESIKCSEIAKLARIEVLLSNNVKDNVDLIAKLEKQDDTEGKDVDDWDDIKDLAFPHLRKYQTFLDRTVEYYYNSQSVYKEFFNPVKKYTPDYENLYGYFAVEGDNIVFRCYRIQPYASKATMPAIQINNPNTSILGKETFTTYPVIDVSTEDELPKEAKYVGKRAFVDIFYRSDFLAKKDVVFFSFDIDNINVSNSIEASTNFLNIAPLGLHFSVVANNFANVNFSVTLNGFLTSYEPIDKLVQLSFAKNYVLNTLLIPYFRSEWGDYYIPKDFNFNQYAVTVQTNAGNDSIIGLGDETIPFVRTISITGKNKLKATVSYNGNGKSGTITFDYDIKDLDEVVIPTEKYYNQDVKKLIDTYTPHELFQHTPLLKKTLVDVFENKRLLDYILTKSVNFFDDNVNTKTNYVNNLLSTLHMMGHDAFEYDQTTFEGVNELRDLCRILSMNHSELVGNLIDESYDIKYSESYKGKHIGDEVFVTDEIYVIPENELTGKKRHQKGKIAKIRRNGELLQLKESTLLVVRDLYTNETKMVNFSDLTPDRKEGGFNIFQLKNYKPTWGWGLLLPDKEDKDGKILQSYYGFYLLISPDHIVRVGNFLEENTITSETETKSTWEESDGKTFDKLQKVIYSALDVV